MIRPLERTGNSANIVFYAERGAKRGDGSVWCEALRGNRWERGDDNVTRPVGPTYFSIRVYRQGVGEVFDFKYTPKRQPPPGELSPRTIARLLRQELARR